MKHGPILVIEDEFMVAEVLQRYLEQQGYQCRLAFTAEEALQRIRAERFAAALVDIRLGGKDGLTLLGEMKALDPDLAAIMVTAVKDRESAVKAMRLGAEDYIVKPFDLEEIDSSLQRALEKRRLVLENYAYQQGLEQLVAERTNDLERRNRELAALNQETMATQRRLATILSETFTGIIVADAQLRLLQFNPAAEAITGYEASEVFNRPLQDVFGPEVCDEGSPLRRAIRTGERLPPIEAVISGRRGRRDILLEVTPLPGDSAASKEYLLSFADITELKEVERLKTNIIANVSHELRTPLASIRAYTELLMEDLDAGDPKLRWHFLEVIDQETQHLAGLITDLLNVARLESGRFEPHYVDISLRDVAEEMSARFQVQAEQQGVQLMVQAPSDLPHLLADPEMMSILVKNLVDNAIKFSPHGGEVRISLWADGERHMLAVADRGIGVSSEDLPHIFEKFYRAHGSIEAGFQGTGLGLALVKEVVQAHGGDIEVESEPGKGSCFTVSLPILRAATEGDNDTEETAHR